MSISNVADYPPERLRPLADYFSPAKVGELNRERVCLIAEEAGRIVGTAALEGGELVTFFVLPEHQGRGIGAALLGALEASARTQGRARLGVNASLTGAAFYERHGYLRTGETFEGTAGPQVPMGKPLG